MGVIVDLDKCNGCGGMKEPLCIRYCPGDLMAQDQKTGKAYIRNNSDCWDCFVCVKYCPKNALSIRLPYKISNYKASLEPKVSEDKTKWTLTNTKGQKENFETKALEIE